MKTQVTYFCAKFQILLSLGLKIKNVKTVGLAFFNQQLTSADLFISIL